MRKRIAYAPFLLLQTIEFINGFKKKYISFYRKVLPFI